MDRVLQDLVERVRRFTRFYTRRLGTLEESLLGSQFSLAEARVLYELATRDGPAATEIGQALGLDAGYLSRILRRFETRGLIERLRSREDGRRSHLSLTQAGREAFGLLNDASRSQVSGLLAPLSLAEQSRLVEAMATVESLLEPKTAPPTYLLRPHRPGDIGWIVHRHGALYAQEYDWDERFEALVAEIAASFIKDFDPKRERSWIAEIDGEIVGSVILVKASDEVAKLRLLYVEPKARGLGIGRHLVDECVRFARAAGYRRIMLWTNDVLHAARHIYKTAGFRLIATEQHHSFGHDLVGETWELELE
ncbi:bifunctional helix-turn-helix transcriptional regulator/GNAT family N-acetyltransferase [Microvirga massiliensis]|uniref:bifunctional helix-turn-helix transcriptional regulator/GNAT family N-acetyltransferase n=1 Tax=Microvirga massiliensis TaxID=1033741 RepID=UPI00062B4B76|nr:bifunctional helix-turn-helix transcriptional regulator/GNAT family N-acetyltransferase [Microvirga massiliensis]